MSASSGPADFPALVGKKLGPSAWFRITQAQVDRFADTTGDHQFIHVDRDRARRSPFGGTVAHGFLTLSLIPQLTAGLGVGADDVALAVNYGADRVRFLQPVRVGGRVRAYLEYLEAEEKRPGEWLVKYRVTVEIEDEAKPAMVADLLALYLVRKDK